MEISKHGRSFLVKNDEKEEYIPKILLPQAAKPSKKETAKTIRGLHKSGTRTIKELSLIYKLSETEVEKIISE